MLIRFILFILLKVLCKQYLFVKVLLYSSSDIECLVRNTGLPGLLLCSKLNVIAGIPFPLYPIRRENSTKRRSSLRQAGSRISVSEHPGLPGMAYTTKHTQSNIKTLKNRKLPVMQRRRLCVDVARGVLTAKTDRKLAAPLMKINKARNEFAKM